MANSAHRRCSHCAGPLSKEMETSNWTVAPLIRDSFCMAPPVTVFSSACAGLAGGAIPTLAQLASSSYHGAVSSPLPPQTSLDDQTHKSRISSTFSLQKLLHITIPFQWEAIAPDLMS